MKFIRHNFNENYHAFDGEDRQGILADELAKTLVMEPVLITQIFEENNIDVPNSSPKALTRLMRDHRGNKKLIEQITGVVFALNSDFDGGTHAFFGKNRAGNKAARQGRRAEKDYAKSLKGNDREKGAFFKKLGGFVSNNKDAIGGAVSGIQGLLANRQQANQLQTGVSHYQQMQVPEIGGQKRMPTWGWALIGVGTIAIVATLIYTIRKRR